jgi:hypothetical protein
MLAAVAVDLRLLAQAALVVVATAAHQTLMQLLAQPILAAVAEAEAVAAEMVEMVVQVS